MEWNREGRDRMRSNQYSHHGTEEEENEEGV